MIDVVRKSGLRAAVVAVMVTIVMVGVLCFAEPAAAQCAGGRLAAGPLRATGRVAARVVRPVRRAAGRLVFWRRG